MTQDEFLEDMIDNGEVVVEAKELRHLLQKAERLLKDIWKKNYYSLLEEKRLKIDLKV